MRDFTTRFFWLVVCTISGEKLLHLILIEGDLIVGFLVLLVLLDHLLDIFVDVSDGLEGTVAGEGRLDDLTEDILLVLLGTAELGAEHVEGDLLVALLRMTRVVQCAVDVGVSEIVGREEEGGLRVLHAPVVGAVPEGLLGLIIAEAVVQELDRTDGAEDEAVDILTVELGAVLHLHRDVVDAVA